MKRDQFPLGVIALQVMTGFLTAVMTTLLFLSTRQVDWHVLFVRQQDFPVLLLVIGLSLLLPLAIGSMHYFFLRRDFKRVTTAIIELEQGKDVTIVPGPYFHTLTRLSRIGKRIDEQVETVQKISTRPQHVEQVRIQNASDSHVIYTTPFHNNFMPSR